MKKWQEIAFMLKRELQESIGDSTRLLLKDGLHTLLDLARRFYKRQFETRKKIDSDLLVKFENILDNYFTQNNMNRGLPTVAWCASELCLSPNYFGDLIKKETGVTAKDYIKKHVVEATEEALADPRQDHHRCQLRDRLSISPAHEPHVLDRRQA